ncbi:nucleotidyltransferase family protein [Albibacterium sp.]|uniref:nucleotidyltransferase family protein n=1 Tax=Albibacterium sp. TaxID=2952885 RepID=UPI002CAC6FC6|nr:nucleotidyltransferase family protein [Albibacterium sp.]HUH18928.1 nucleotidyltransferase family protein [Albibacterium sp.]
MSDFIKHIIPQNESVRDALGKLDALASDAILFVVDSEFHLIGSLTDGDLRRGFIKGLGFDDSLLQFIQKNPIYITRTNYTLEVLESYKDKHFKIIPIVDEDKVIIDVLNFRIQKTIIPADGVLMAGGQGKRLRPLTENTPKPLLKVGDKPIIEYNIDRLVQYGIKNINLSINYLGEQIESYFGNGERNNARISYVCESKPLGTIGSIHLVDNFEHDDILVMNSDLLTNIDFADFYSTFKNSGADMAVAATSYHVDVPYAVLEVDGKNLATSLKEKPRYTYYSNAGIYFIKKSLLEMIPKGEFFDITELMETLLAKDMKLITYPITGYWLDIGKHEDFKKAQEDIKHIKF